MAAPRLPWIHAHRYYIKKRKRMKHKTISSEWRAFISTLLVQTLPLSFFLSFIARWKWASSHSYLIVSWRRLRDGRTTACHCESPPLSEKNKAIVRKQLESLSIKPTQQRSTLVGVGEHLYSHFSFTLWGPGRVSQRAVCGPGAADWPALTRNNQPSVSSPAPN